jgi:hypothetical protein
MPNARMAEDATLRVTVANDELADIYNITFQALPRLQATFRYTIFNPDEISGSRDDLRDRSYEIKSSFGKNLSGFPKLPLVQEMSWVLVLGKANMWPPQRLGVTWILP